MKRYEYSAGGVKLSFWFMEFRKTVSLLSYAVGCMFGRYSLDVDGLAYAGGEWKAERI